MTKMLKPIVVAFALVAVTAGASGAAMAGPHDNPSVGLYPNNYWGK